jgi:hypothetical protein
MKDLNLLPSNIKFDYEKVYILKIITYIILFNLALLLIITVNENFIIYSYKKELNQKKSYLNKITTLNTSFNKYNEEYAKLKKYLSDIKEKEKTFFEYYRKDYSPLVATLIHIDAIKTGIYIDSWEYSDGFFIIDGYAVENNNFYDYYKGLENNKYIAELDFSSLKAKKETNNFSFKISFRVRKIDEIF